MEPLRIIIEVVFLTALAIFGLISNSTTIVVLVKGDLRLRASIKILLIALAVYDELFLLLVLTQFGASSLLDQQSGYRMLLSPYVLPMIQIAMTASVWTTVAVSLERYLTVCKNYRPSNMVRHTVMLYLVPIALFSVLFNVPRFFEFTSQWKDFDIEIRNETTGLLDVIEQELVLFETTPLRNDPTYHRDYVTAANFIFLLLVPFTILVALNFMISWAIIRRRQRVRKGNSNANREHAIAYALIIVVVIFLICHSLRFVINLHECLIIFNHSTKHTLEDLSPPWIVVLIHVSHLALVFNSSVNLFVYVLMDLRFRKIFLDEICCRRFSSQVESSCTVDSDHDTFEMTKMDADDKVNKTTEEATNLIT